PNGKVVLILETDGTMDLPRVAAVERFRQFHLAFHFAPLLRRSPRSNGRPHSGGALILSVWQQRPPLCREYFAGQTQFVALELLLPRLPWAYWDSSLYSSRNGRTTDQTGRQVRFRVPFVGYLHYTRISKAVMWKLFREAGPFGLSPLGYLFGI